MKGVRSFRFGIDTIQLISRAKISKGIGKRIKTVAGEELVESVGEWVVHGGGGGEGVVHSGGGGERVVHSSGQITHAFEESVGSEEVSAFVDGKFEEFRRRDRSGRDEIIFYRHRGISKLV